MITLYVGHRHLRKAIDIMNDHPPEIIPFILHPKTQADKRGFDHHFNLHLSAVEESTAIKLIHMSSTEIEDLRNEISYKHTIQPGFSKYIIDVATTATKGIVYVQHLKKHRAQVLTGIKSFLTSSLHEFSHASLDTHDHNEWSYSRSFTPTRPQETVNSHYTKLRSRPIVATIAETLADHPVPIPPIPRTVHALTSTKAPLFSEVVKGRARHNPTRMSQDDELTLPSQDTNPTSNVSHQATNNTNKTKREIELEAIIVGMEATISRHDKKTDEMEATMKATSRRHDKATEELKATITQLQADMRSLILTIQQSQINSTPPRELMTPERKRKDTKTTPVKTPVDADDEDMQDDMISSPILPARLCQNDPDSNTTPAPPNDAIS